MGAAGGGWESQSSFPGVIHSLTSPEFNPKMSQNTRAVGDLQTSPYPNPSLHTGEHQSLEN